MKISINTIKELNDDYKTLGGKLDLSVDQLATRIGAQLGAVEETIDIGAKYHGIIIVKVVSCEQHPNADRLHVCLIDDGGVAQNIERNKDGLVQVVCGAPNVKAGITVAWLPPGSTVPETYDKEPFVLGTRELRGFVSNGMLASPKELAIGDSHDGILVIEDDHTAGEDFAEAFGLKDDSVIDIENKMFTHRPDCFGFLGVAREIAGISGVKFTSPKWYSLNPEFAGPESDALELNIQNDLPELVPRFTAIAMSNVSVKPSPVWLQVRLARVGLRPINNIVDLTNLYMLETGQPLHAYDYDKVKSLSQAEATIVIRKPKELEKLQLINGKEIQPRGDAIIIATDKQAIGLGGIMGGSETEVDADTKNIIIECANFDMYSIRKSSMEHGLFTDASTRFTKGQSPLQNPAVIIKIAEDIKKYAGGNFASALIDDNHLDSSVMTPGSLFKPVVTTSEFINKRLGLSLTDQQIKEILENVEFEVELKEGQLIVTAPFWRTDIELAEDIVEETGRLYGFDHLPLILPQRSILPAKRDVLLQAKHQIRQRLSSLGANEVLTYSFVHGDLLGKVGQDKAKAFEVGNALRPELQYYRISLMPSLLEKVHPNIKASYDNFALFELAKVHDVDSMDTEGLPTEYEYTGLVVAKADKLKDPASAFYYAKRYLTELAQAPLEFKPLTETTQNFPVASPYEPKRSAMVYVKQTNEFLGLVGEFKQTVRRKLKLPIFTSGFEVDTQVLQKAISSSQAYTPIPRFPELTQDISFKVKTAISYQELFDVAISRLNELKPANCAVSLEAKDIYQGDDKDHKNITLRLKIASYERTLTDQEVNLLLNKVAEIASNTIQAVRL
ncbi:MAG TPA: phenylalanine--tRNA ligase subunit beta [Candidatus Saccharimonadales bacterium]|nr:phenylalanine--tRNA ligase subunit beta [Candidatus Saccharimonadales bacterium]